jgi:hypothetical protein
VIRCLFKPTDITPCVIEDGPACYDQVDGRAPVCVGCDRTVERITEDLEARGHDPIYPADTRRLQ